jgi:hypothetical protein
MAYIRVAYQGIFWPSLFGRFCGDTVRSGYDKNLPALGAFELSGADEGSDSVGGHLDGDGSEEYSGYSGDEKDAGVADQSTDDFGEAHGQIQHNMYTDDTKGEGEPLASGLCALGEDDRRHDCPGAGQQGSA